MHNCSFILMLYIFKSSNIEVQLLQLKSFTVVL